MVYLKRTDIDVDVERLTVGREAVFPRKGLMVPCLQALGVNCIELDAETTEGMPKYDAKGVKRALRMVSDRL